MKPAPGGRNAASRPDPSRRFRTFNPQAASAQSTPAARAMLHANLATVHIMQGDLKQASRCALKALELQPANRNALLCSVYLEVRAGNLEVAIAWPIWPSWQRHSSPPQPLIGRFPLPGCSRAQLEPPS